MRGPVENLYSSFVTWLKILLPLAALAILSSVVFFARESEDVREIPFLTSGGPDTPAERVAAPEYQGVTDDGSKLRLTAEEVRPSGDTGGWLDVDDITGRLETPSGRIIQATAPGGRLNFDQDKAELVGIVSVDTSDGFHMLSQDLFTRLDITFARSGGPVRGEAPFGELQAGGMQIGDLHAPSELLVFNGGVKLIYQPGT